MEVLGLKLREALDLLEKKNIKAETVETVPPGNKSGKGSKRVLAVKEINQGYLKIIWSYEDYEYIPPPERG